jgi:outer membrane protein assembly factor BamB
LANSWCPLCYRYFLNNMKLGVLVVVTFLLDRGIASSNTADSKTWSGWGGGLRNTRYAESNTKFDSTTITGITKSCEITHTQGVSATPSISNGLAYYTTWNGLLVCLEYTTCTIKWITNITTIINSYGPIDPSVLTATSPVSRSSPQIDEKARVVYVGTLVHALVVAVDRDSGKFLGNIQLNSHPLAVVTMSPTWFDGSLFIGVSSVEWLGDAVIPGYKCCSFVGNLVSLAYDGTTSEFIVHWNISTVPVDEAGSGEWTGAGAWGSQPAIDVERRQVFFGTGNLYAVPAAYQHCMNSTTQQADPNVPCLPSDILQESIVAVDIDTGVINWLKQMSPLDAWTFACGFTVGGPVIDPVNCPQTPGPDSDFGMAPAFIPGWSGTLPNGTAVIADALIVGQKNGNLYAIGARNGDIFWALNTSPPGIGGGLSWGIAVDRERVYYNAINLDRVAWNVVPSNQSTNGSAYGAVSLKDGTPLWGTLTQTSGVAYGPPTAVGDIVLSNSPFVTGSGGLVVLDQATGKILWNFVSDAPSHGGFVVQDEYLLFGTGYSRYNGSGSLYVMKT